MAMRGRAVAACRIFVLTMDCPRIQILVAGQQYHVEATMIRRWNLLYTLALLFFVSLPAAQGAGIDLQPGLTGSWYEPRTGGQGLMVAVYGDRPTYDTVTV